MGVVRIDYVVDDDQVKAATKSLDNLDESTKQAKESAEDLGDASEDGAQGMSELGDQAKSAANNVSLFGVGLGDAAGKLAGATKATNLFGVALKALPIVAVVAALGSLFTFLTKTQRGQDLLRIQTARLSAAFDVLRDRIARVGEIIVQATGEFGQAETKLTRFLNVTLKTDPALVSLTTSLKILKAIFPDLTEEIARESEEAAKLEKRLIALERIERGFAVARAQANVEIERNKLIAEDITRSFDERAEAAQRALDLETQALNNQLKTQRLLIDTLQERIQLGESVDEDFIELEQARIRLAELEAASVTKSIELNNKLNTILQQRFDSEIRTAELRVEAREADLNGIDETIEKEIEASLTLGELRRQQFIEQEAIRIRNEELEEQARQNRVKREKEAANELLTITAGFLDSNSNFVRGVAIFEAILNTRTAVTKALSSAPPPLNFLLAAAVAARGFAQVASINSQSKPQFNVPQFKDGVIDLDGPGTATSDSIHARLSKGESVMTARETQDFLPTLKAIRKGDIDADLLNGIAKNPDVVNNNQVIQVPTQHFSLDERGFQARIVKGVTQTKIKSNSFSW